MKKTKNNNLIYISRKGFTLVELLIVVTIIVIVSAISFGALIRSQDQQIFNSSFEKVISLISNARSLAITGKGQLDFTDYDKDGCKDSGVAAPGCSVPDFVTPANYGVNFAPGAGTSVVKLFGDINPPESGATGQKGAFNAGTNYAKGDDLPLDTFSLPKNVSLKVLNSSKIEIPSGSALFFSPNYADITFSSGTLINDFFYVQISDISVVNRCKLIKFHKLAGVPEIANCS